MFLWSLTLRNPTCPLWGNGLMAGTRYCPCSLYRQWYCLFFTTSSHMVDRLLLTTVWSQHASSPTSGACSLQSQATSTFFLNRSMCLGCFLFLFIVHTFFLIYWYFSRVGPDLSVAVGPSYPTLTPNHLLLLHSYTWHLSAATVILLLSCYCTMANCLLRDSHFYFQYKPI